MALDTNALIAKLELRRSALQTELEEVVFLLEAARRPKRPGNPNMAAVRAGKLKNQEETGN